MKKNLDKATVDSFGNEWGRFNQSNLPAKEAHEIFDKYFSIFPWKLLPDNAEGFDLGCGTGRWAKFVAGRVGHLTCIDPSEALEVAKYNLSDYPNITYLKESVNSLSLDSESQDFGYSLGVLHHVPYTESAIKDCGRLLKKGAPLLLYLYYAFDNRSVLFKFMWKISDLLRIFISSLPNSIKFIFTDLLAAFIYLPVSKLSLMLEKLGFVVDNIPLSFYKDCSFYTMRTDSRDRFGTPLEKRFTKDQILTMMKESGFDNIEFSDSDPFWCVVGIKK